MHESTAFKQGQTTQILQKHIPSQTKFEGYGSTNDSVVKAFIEGSARERARRIQQSNMNGTQQKGNSIGQKNVIIQSDEFRIA